MNIRFVIEQEAGKQNFNVITTIEFQNFEDGIRNEITKSMLETLREMFEIETISAEVTRKDRFTTIKISTDNTDKINALNSRLLGLLKKEQKLDLMKFKIEKFNLN